MWVVQAAGGHLRGLDEEAVTLSIEMRSFAEEGAWGSPAREQQTWNGCDPASNYRSGARV